MLKDLSVEGGREGDYYRICKRIKKGKTKGKWRQIKGSGGKQWTGLGMAKINTIF